MNMKDTFETQFSYKKLKDWFFLGICSSLTMLVTDVLDI